MGTPWTPEPVPTGETPHVVVGVDGSPASVRALTYARAEASRTGARLRVLHVLPDVEAFGAPFVVPEEDLRRAGRELVAEALAEAGIDTDEVDVVLRRGRPVGALLDAAREAELVVVGADQRSLAARVITGNTTAGVAAGSSATVVVVPEDRRDTEEGAPVLVGVEDPRHSFRVLGEACARAAALGTRLTVLHAWHLPTGYEDVIADRVAAAEWEARAHREIEPLVAEWTGVFPTVPVEVVVCHDQAAYALVRASQDCAELVLVRRSHGIPGARHLGATARAVLRAAHCPVRVVPSGHVVDVPQPAQRGSMSIVGGA